jgi:peptide chain release factor subunit 1
MSLPFNLKALADRFDASSQPTYLSLYADLSDSRHVSAMGRRQREIRAAMPSSHARARLDETMARVLAAYERARIRPGTRAVAVFAGPDGFLEEHSLQAALETRVVLDSSPYIAPLARFADDNESCVLALLDSEHAAIFVVWAGRAQLLQELETSLIGRHRHGGMSQMRFQRHREGQVDHFYDYVAGHVARIVETEGVARIAVAGPGPAKRDFVSRMPQALRSKVALVADVDFKVGPADDTLVRRFVALMRDEEAKQSVQWLEALRRELAIGELAITGALECAQQAASGRVERLIVLGGASMAGGKCEEHQEVFQRGGRCHCGAAGADVDLVNEAVEFTTRSDGQCEFVESAEHFLDEAGGIGALLRW